MDYILEIAKLGTIIIIGLIGAFLVFGFIIGEIQKESNKYIVRIFGEKGIFIVHAIGTPIHELSHLLMCLLFGHKVKEIKLFRPIASKSDGVLGYVKSSSNTKNIYQNIGNFFIGAAPLFIGGVIIFLAMFLFLPESLRIVLGSSSLSIKLIVKTIFSLYNIKTIRFWIFIFITIGISTSMSLSKEDIMTSKRGALYLAILSYFVAFVIIVFNINTVAIFKFLKVYNYIFISIFLIGTISSICTFLLVKIISFIKF
ncbi:M50 family metallopeptidase [Clostridium bornimense]|uniref:M50 family metallopeptidase n=1 Tax=Clostridium bornimense TaxID=1216932 RepID=UPI001C11C479|nr:M50 family metallopeptidase [Clostridium bornimense]MBU5317546.1 M50 family metallopeptidase [Clostridium bornimense]